MPAMIDEIHEQPKAVQAVLRDEQKNIESLCRTVKSRDISCVVIVGRGTSDHAATVSKYLFEIMMGIPVALAAPSVLTLYDSRLDFSRCLVIGISQSGQSPDVVEYIAQARAWGGLTVAITNDVSSELASASEHTICCHAGEEKSVATTKTYTATLAACYLFALKYAENERLLEELQRVPDAMAAVMESEEFIQDTAPRYRFMEECFVMARGINLATAHEAALKIQETSYVGARPYSVADFAHGPIAVVHEGLTCFLFAPDGKAYTSVLHMIQTLSQKRAETVVYSNNDEALRRATIGIRMPDKIDELMTPMFYIIPAQMFAYYLSLNKGYNPDRPRGLTKVTITR